MMNRPASLIATVGLLLAGCSSSPFQAVPGAQALLHRGEGTNWYVLGLPVSVNASIEQACRSGGIDYVATIDTEWAWYFFVWRQTVIVTGETASEYWSHRGESGEACPSCGAKMEDSSKFCKSCGRARSLSNGGRDAR